MTRKITGAARRGPRGTMLNCELTAHGVGYERGYWTHVLIAPL